MFDIVIASWYSQLSGLVALGENILLFLLLPFPFLLLCCFCSILSFNLLLFLLFRFDSFYVMISTQGRQQSTLHTLHSRAN
ncbi:hypothetical protein BZA77DRAFT_317017 [Pyronema omphalodes]|nr:hypothetical protein BZA77DRAFT_317017 [Pyronema omphalodes]